MRESVSSLANVPLANFCTYHTGGKVRELKIVYDADGLLENATGDFVVIGCGSKLLVSDKGYDGRVILMRISGMQLTERGVYAYAGVPLPALSRFCETNGLGGLEWACGIPGSVGGALRLNAGAFGRSVSDCLIGADVLIGGGIERIGAEQLALGYRESGFRGVVVGAEFSCSRCDKDALAARRKEYFSARRLAQPRGFSCGSVFRNADRPAGWYIEQAGLKGMKQGGAIISEKHANFIINTGFATTRDIYTLIRAAKAEVKDKFGVALREEVIYLGEF